MAFVVLVRLLDGRFIGTNLPARRAAPNEQEKVSGAGAAVRFVSKREQEGHIGDLPGMSSEQRSAGQKGCERGDLNPHALSGTGS